MRRASAAFVAILVILAVGVIAFRGGYSFTEEPKIEAEK